MKELKNTMAYIYKIINDINNKIYIGKTENSIEKRFKEHCSDAFRDRNEKRPLYNAMRKYGTEHFHIELIEETDNPEEREIYWIGFYDSYTKGYNATLGGDGRCLYDHKAIASRLKEHPYPCDIAQEFNCSRDIIYNIAKQYNIVMKNKGYETMEARNGKMISAFTKSGEFIQSFKSTAAAAEWCYENQKCATLNSGVRSHIAEAANGKRKSAYTYIWKYN